MPSISNPLRGVRGGESSKPSAKAFNLMLQAAEANARSRKFGNVSGCAPEREHVLIQAGATAIGRFTPVALGASLFPSPTNTTFTSTDPNAPPDSQWLSRPAFSASAAVPNQPFAIALDPIAANGFGRAMVSGIAPVVVSVLNGTDAYVQVFPDGSLGSGPFGTGQLVWQPGATGLQWCLVQVPCTAMPEAYQPWSMFRITGGSGGTVTIGAGAYRRAGNIVLNTTATGVTVGGDNQYIGWQYFPSGGVLSVMNATTPSMPTDMGGNVCGPLYQMRYVVTPGGAMTWLSMQLQYGIINTSEFE